MTTYTGTNNDDIIVSDADIINARKGADTVTATNPVLATINAGEGNDVVAYTGSGESVQFGGDGADLLQGGALLDRLFGEYGADTLMGGDGDDQLDGGESADRLEGGLGADSLTGGEGADTLLGGDDFDRFRGGSGNDSMSGEGGDDFFFAERPFAAHEVNWYDGGAGTDTVYFGDTQAVRVDLANSAANGGDASGAVLVSIEQVIGSQFNDVLKGNNSSNRLEGGSGDDVLAGLGGSDRLIGGEGDDTIQGQGGNDSVEGGLGDDLLSGGAGGRDYFVTREYHDREPGDEFGWGHDTITDFEDGVDLIDFRDSVEFGHGFQFSELTITQDGADTIIAAGEADGGGPLETIRLLNINASQITSADFLF